MRADINVAMAVWMVVAVVVAGVVVGGERPIARGREVDCEGDEVGRGCGGGRGARWGGWRGAARGVRAGRRVELGRDRGGCGGWASEAT
jgi:hypothetical protein